MNETELLFDLLKEGVSPVHAVASCEKRLQDAGFTSINYEDDWKLQAGGRYVINHHDTTLFAFTLPDDHDTLEGTKKKPAVRIAAAHTDFPCLRIKPSADIRMNSYAQVNVEVYGGAILNTWLDRPLGIAGRVALKSKDPFAPEVRTFCSDKSLLTIPNLAIHMNREVNKGVELNRQNDLEPLAFVDGTEVEKEFFLSLLARELKVSASEILDYELYLYNCDAGDVLGIQEDMISAPRLDNITSVEACLQGLLNQNREKGINVIALFDNEEIGSRTKQGADSEFLYRLLKKIYRCLGVAEEKAETAIFGGFALSLDVAHGFHPNKPEKSDPTNPNPLGKGVVIKRSSAQNYVTDSEAVATAMMIFENEGIPYQKFASRSDVSQGGTLGSIASKYLPMKMVDMGVPILAMHSARELMAAADQYYLEEFVTAFFEQ